MMILQRDNVYMDGYFSYPVSTYMQHGKHCYVYRCSRCNKEVSGYRKMRVKGKVLCYSCEREIARDKYNARKVEECLMKIMEE